MLLKLGPYFDAFFSVHDLLRELPIFTTKAHVFHIDPETKKKWVPLSMQAVTVSYYHDSARHLYRIISVDGTQVLVNSTLVPNMTFTKTSQKFGQWSDMKANTVYGLGFASEEELLKFMDKFNEVKSFCALPPVDVIGRLSPQHELNAKVVDESVLHDQLEQARYENDRLKIALAQSSANAKKWESELQTLRNNNARLTSALQESASNVEQWKKQLEMYKDENDKLHARELDQLKPLISNMKTLEVHNQQLKTNVEDLEAENLQLKTKLEELSKKLEQFSVKRGCEDKLRLIQQQINTKINELYVMNDKLAEFLQNT